MPITETKDTGPCSKTLTIEVPAEQVKEQVDAVYKELHEKAEVPGFRRGKAPISVLQMRFARSVEGESRLKAVEAAWLKAIEELDLKIVGEPNVHDVEGEGDEPIKFQVDLQYFPEVNLGEYKGIAVQVLKQEADDAQVDKTLESMRERQAYLAPVEGRPAAEWDIVTVDSVATVDDEEVPESKMEGYRFRVGSKTHLPGFEESVIGKNTDEVAEADIQLPEDFSVERHRGKTARFTLKIRNISERKLPDLDDELAKDLGAESIEDLRKTIRQNIERSIEMEKPRAIRTAYEDRLIESHKFDIPPVLVEGEEAYIAAIHESHLARMGINYAALTEEQKAATDAVNRETAERNVRLSILLRKMADQEGLSVNDDELEDYIEETANRQGEDPGRFRIHVDNMKMEAYFRKEALEKKVMDAMIGGLKVEWVDSLPEKQTPEPEEQKDSAPEA